MEIKTPLPPVPTDDSTVKLLGKPTREIAGTPKLIIIDLLAGNNFNASEFIHRVAEPNVTGADVLASMNNVASDFDMNTPDRLLYGALDIPVSKKGLGVCNYRTSEYENERLYYVPKQPWTTTYTPAGAITHTHMDFYGRHQYFVHLFGKKLWLLWPPTPGNLEKISKYHTHLPQPDTTLRCIDELEGLQLYYAHKEEVFVLGPNVLHACISFTMSAHTGTWLWNSENVEKSLGLIRWGIDWLKSVYGADGPKAAYEMELQTVERDIEGWESFFGKGDVQGEFEEAKAQLSFQKDLLSGVKKMYVTTPKSNKRRRLA